jgi:16S rRNA (guanine966-N2)-methyltransferase
MSLSITGGRFNGSVLRTPAGANLTRPTSGKVRQALFNVLQNALRDHLPGGIEDARFVDLFAGSGSVGLEALSRGARKTLLVESHPAAFKVLEANCRLLLSRGAEPDTLEWLRQDARVFCKNARAKTAAERFDVVFADPPFGQDFSSLPELLRPLLKPNGLAVVQFPSRNPPGWVAMLDSSAPGGGRVLVYGESSLAIFGPE